MKLIRSITLGLALLGVSLPSAMAINIGLNPASPLQGYDLGGGSYATLVGVQYFAGSTLVGETITAADLNAAINSGTVSGWYYAAGNPSSAMFGNINPYAPFVSDVVVAGSANPARIWDSLWAIHSGTVVFKNGRGGTTTMAVGTVARITGQDPFSPVPDTGATLLLALMGFAGLVALKRKSVR